MVMLVIFQRSALVSVYNVINSMHSVIYRSLCEVSFDDERQTDEKEENNDKEVYTQPLFQRIIHIWSTLWTDSGKAAVT